MQVQAWRDCFVFFKHEDAGKGPQMASRLLDVLAAGSGSGIQTPSPDDGAGTS
jgi:hypothetical protein